MSDRFHPITLDEMPAYRALHRASGSRAADYSFSNLWGWAEHYGLEWRFSDSLCWIRQTRPEVRCWAPMGDWAAIPWRDMDDLPAFGAFIRVPGKLSALWEQAMPGRVSVEETRGHWDYLYNSAELASLSGNRFHKKKNLLNQFLKLYPDAAYLPMTIDCVESVLKMQEEWCQWRECLLSEALLAENTAVERVLRHWDVLPDLTGGVIIIKGKVVAYTVAEPLTDDTLVVHFEKGTTEYKGIYQAINCFFVRQEGAAYTYVNREQDLDDQSLRKAKESYNPAAFVRKNTVRVRA